MHARILRERTMVKENWMSTNKPQHWVIRDRNRQENNTQYQRYCQNDYKRDKKKFEETITDLILGIREINKDITNNQNKTTLKVG